ncbi:hypothetical protein [Zestomonas thermotolerans]|uniref:hypothetical protein n=1 Tax=Zestomonas thermotolerans TaxID=157784 RepID=UPI0003780831|nr:hypothetical protein [Pseudomonas thermotolerans]
MPLQQILLARIVEQRLERKIYHQDRLRSGAVRTVSWYRPRASLGYSPPISRAPLPLDNVLGLPKYTEIKATWIKL